jgi:MFS family permease
MASAFAWYSTWRELGHSLGIGAAGLVIGFYGSYSSVFLIAFFMSCAGLVTVARYVREHPAADPEDMTQTAAVRGDRPKAGSWALYRPLIPYAAFGMMVAGTAEMVKGLFPVIATQYANLSVAEAGFAASASSLAFLVAGPFFGWLSDHVSRRLALGARSLANTVSSVLYVLFPSFAGVLIARVVDDTGKVAFKPTWGAVLAEVSEADPARRGRTIAFVDSAYTLGEVLGPLAAGLLMAWFGIPVMLGVRAAIGLIAELQAVLLFRKPSPPVRSLAQGELR